MHLLTPNAIKYTIRHLFRVAYPDFIKPMLVDIKSDRLSAIVTINSKEIIFKISEDNDINKLLSGKLVFKNISTADGTHTIPVILNKEAEFAQINENVLMVNADIISLSFIMLSRYEETIIKELDKFGNFNYKNSISYKYNFIDFPIVDEYAMIFQKYLKILFHGINLGTNKYEVIPTHDIDEIYRYNFSYIGIRRIIGDILLNKNINDVFNSIRTIKDAFKSRKNDPFFKSLEILMDVSRRLNLRSEFYFMAAKKSKYNSGYDLNGVLVKDVINNLLKSNMIIGLHGGFGTRSLSSLLELEKETLQNVCKKPLLNGRQHYLHFDINKTYEVIEKAGFELDSTLGYNEKEGFRCGTCYEFHPWNFSEDLEMKLIERPLIVMDVTLFASYTKREAFIKILSLNSRCKAVGGKFVILWHNAYVERKKDWFNEVYVRFLETIMN
jgi:hypothetical protein